MFILHQSDAYSMKPMVEGLDGVGGKGGLVFIKNLAHYLSH